MGSLFQPDIPAPPPPPPPSTVRDEINRVEQVPVKNADGSTTYVTREIPPTAEEQAEMDELNRIMDESLQEIERLSSTDFEVSESTKRSLDAWEAERRALLADNFESRSGAEERNLAKRGLSDSTAARNIRRQRNADERDELENIDRERDVIRDNIRNQQLNNQYQLFNLASSQEDADAVRRQQSALQGQQQVISANATQNASLNDYYRAQLTNSQNTNQLITNTAASFIPGGNIFAGGLRSIF